MRLFDNEALLNMDSPIKHILAHLTNALINVAPERLEEFDRRFPTLTIRITNDSKPLAVTDGDSVIEISRAFAEFCWCSCYAYSILYDNIFCRSELKEREILNLRANPRTRICIDMIEWSLQNFIGGKNLPWPDEFPRPVPLPGDVSPGDPIHVAQEYCLIGLACVVLHELGHIALRHSPEMKARYEMEREADRFAWEWVLGEAGIPWSEYMKRAIGITLCMIAFSCAETHAMGNSDTHPRWYDRYSAFAVEYFGDEPNAHIWGIAVVLLKIHMDDAGIKAPEEVETSLKDLADIYFDILSERS